MNSDNDNSNLRPHQYDGIQEYDNQLPRWWLYGFYASIAFAAAYFYWYQVSGSSTDLREAYLRDHAAEVALQQANAPQKKQPSEEELLALLHNPDALKKGEEQFRTKCVSCHGAEGEGLIGPNLTDDYWIHGNKMSEMYKVVTEGVLAKGMPTWSALMTDEEMQAATAYIKTLHGKKVKNPKKPEGVLLPNL